MPQRNGVVDTAGGQDVLSCGWRPHAPHAVLTGVALGGGDDHALVGQGLGGGGDRVVGHQHVVGTDGQVDDVHAVGGGPLHGGGHHLRIGAALAAEDPVGADLGVGGHAGDRLGACAAGAGGDTGHMGAMSTAVIGVWVRHGPIGDLGGLRRHRWIAVTVADEVISGNDLGVREGGGAVTLGGRHARGAGAAELGVVVVDAGVDDADLDALTGVTELGLDDAGAGQVQCGGHLGGEQPLFLLGLAARIRGNVLLGLRNADDGLNRGHLVECGQSLDGGVVDGQGQPVPQVAVCGGDLGLNACLLDGDRELAPFGGDDCGTAASGDGG